MAEDASSSSMRIIVSHHRGDQNVSNETPKWCRTHLFQKELTPSDVGKLNRLVIPKKFALKYFSNNYTLNEYDKDNDVELVFYDKGMKSWRFRYCYWRSSQSFVFTRGWNRFVKDKKLKEKDIITFYRCNVAEHHQFFFIDITRHRSSYEANANGSSTEMDLIGFNLRPLMTHKEETLLATNNIDVQGKGVRLFGVQLL